MPSFHDKVIYQIYPKSFYDSDGDGMGDLCGITQKLDYLAGLGVDMLWLTPFFPSPQRDNGYDVADYRAVDPRFGTMDDLEALIAAAAERGIGLMLDMVFNHTSTAHEWFQKALAGDETYQQYYIFRDGAPDTPPTNWQSKFGGSAWAWLPDLGKWYLHLFDETQADLNWANPAVREELKEILRFWKGKGIRGFRFDVINLISKPDIFRDDPDGDGRCYYTDGAHVHEYLRELVRDAGLDETVTVGELSSTDLRNFECYTVPSQRELNMCFSFHHLKVDYKNGDKWSLMPPDLARLKQHFADWQNGLQQSGGWSALFWCNHDQPRIVSRLGNEGRYWQRSAKMLAAAIHLMRGTPYIFQGEELGMTNPHYTAIDQYRDVESKNYYHILLESGKTPRQALAVLAARSRDNGRTPMQWSAGKNGGFTTGTPWITPAANFPRINAAAQCGDPDSIYHWYRRLIALRKSCPVIAEGQIEFLWPDRADVFAYRRWDDQTELLVLCGWTEQSAKLILPQGWQDAAVLLCNTGTVPARDGDTVVLPPYGCMVLLHQCPESKPR